MSAFPRRRGELFSKKKYSEKTEEILSMKSPAFRLIKKGDEVLALFRDDGQFYRAEILAVMHFGYFSARYDVLYIDYGNKDTITWRDLRIENPSKIALLRAQTESLQTSSIDDKSQNSLNISSHLLTTDCFGRDISRRQDRNSKKVSFYCLLTVIFCSQYFCLLFLFRHSQPCPIIIQLKLLRMMM